jgi:hypothetical protein
MAVHEYIAWDGDADPATAGVFHRCNGWWSVVLWAYLGDDGCGGFMPRDISRPHGFRSERAAQDYAEDFATALTRSARAVLSTSEHWEGEPIPVDSNPYDTEHNGQQIPHVAYAKAGTYSADVGGYGYALRRTYC